MNIISDLTLRLEIVAMVLISMRVINTDINYVTFHVTYKNIKIFLKSVLTLVALKF